MKNRDVDPDVMKKAIEAGKKTGFFKPSDVDSHYKKFTGSNIMNEFSLPDWVREIIANKLSALLTERGVKVWGHYANGDFYCGTEALKHEEHITHQALLVCIEELAPKVCNHEPGEYGQGTSLYSKYPECKHCGSQLKWPAKWDVADEG